MTRVYFVNFKAKCLNRLIHTFVNYLRKFPSRRFQLISKYIIENFLSPHKYDIQDYQNRREAHFCKLITSFFL